jgi:hypothetical protein
MHPPVPANKFVHSSILAGEILINDVYEAGKNWKATLLGTPGTTADEVYIKPSYTNTGPSYILHLLKDGFIVEGSYRRNPAHRVLSSIEQGFMQLEEELMRLLVSEFNELPEPDGDFIAGEFGHIQ